MAFFDNPDYVPSRFGATGPVGPVQKARATPYRRVTRKQTKTMRGEVNMSTAFHPLDIAEQIVSVLHQLPRAHAAQVLASVSTHPQLQPHVEAATSLLANPRQYQPNATRVQARTPMAASQPLRAAATRSQAPYKRRKTKRQRVQRAIANYGSEFLS